jgi:hypothetical protein
VGVGCGGLVCDGWMCECMARARYGKKKWDTVPTLEETTAVVPEEHGDLLCLVRGEVDV